MQIIGMLAGIPAKRTKRSLCDFTVAVQIKKAYPNRYAQDDRIWA